MRPPPWIGSRRSRALSCASPLTPLLTHTVAVYEPATARGATVVIPPARTANVSGHGPRSPARDRTIMVVKTLGRRRWKKVSGSHRQGRVEHTCFRDTSMIGEGLRARSPAGQGSEVVLGCEILNRMIALGRPVSYRLDRGGSCRWASCGPVTIRATTPWCGRTGGVTLTPTRSLPQATASQTLALPLEPSPRQPVTVPFALE